MRIKTRILSLLLALGFSSFVHATFKVGIPIFDPPYVYSANEGFAIDLTHIICKRLKASCQLIPMNYDELFTALNKGQIDWIAGGIYIKPDSNYIFSLPYATAKAQFVTLQTSKAQTISDLAGGTIGVVKNNTYGTIYADYLYKTYPGQFRIKEYNSVNNLIMALNNKSISAALLRISVVLYWQENGAGAFKTIGPLIQVGVGIGLMSTFAKAALIQKINVILEQMNNDNTFLTLYKTYFHN
jgi:ABC-type amino acid transport substrate-binding protein